MHYPFDPQTGIFTGASFSVHPPTPEALAANTPEGCALYEGDFDPLCHRIDLQTGELVSYQPPAPPDTLHYTYQWDGAAGRYVAAPTLARLKLDAHAGIDAAAGQARLRHITEVPGQQGTYMRKLEQAKAYAAAGYTGTVPPYIQAEADATGDTPQGAADAILTTAALWDDVLSPGIEGARIAGKRAVTAASTAEAVQSAADAAIAALGVL